MVQTFDSGEVLEHPQLNNMIRALNGDGVISGFAVTQRGIGANMSVDVALGEARISTSLESETGTTNLVIDASHATLHRKDLITYDASADTPAVVKGTNHAGGTGDPIYPPDIPAGDILLAIVDVDAAATTIVTADIHDTRIFVKLLTLFKTIASDDLRDSDDSVEVLTNTWTKIKEFTVPDGVISGTLRIKFAMNETSTGTANGRIRRNGTEVGTARSTTIATYTTWSEDIDGWQTGDTVELWGYWSSTGAGNVKEFRVYCDYHETNIVPAVVW